MDLLLFVREKSPRKSPSGTVKEEGQPVDEPSSKSSIQSQLSDLISKYKIIEKCYDFHYQIKIYIRIVFKFLRHENLKTVRCECYIYIYKQKPKTRRNICNL